MAALPLPAAAFRRRRRPCLDAADAGACCVDENLLSRAYVRTHTRTHARAREQSVVAPLVRASLALHNEGALLPFLAGDLTPVDLMYRLSGVSEEKLCSTYVTLYLCDIDLGQINKWVP